MFEQTDDKLIQKALEGKKSAWLKLIKRYEKSMYKYGLRMLSNPEDAKDLMQEVFISVYRNLSTYRGDGSFKSWIYRIAHFRCVEFYRRKKPTQALEDAPEIEDEALCPEQSVFVTQDGKQLLQAMQKLPLAQKSVVELKFFGNFTFEEIASQLGVSSNTVKSRLYAALDKLKDFLEVEYV